MLVLVLGVDVTYRVAPNTRPRILHIRAIKLAILDLSVHTFVTIGFVVLVEAVVESVAGFIVYDAVRVIIPSLRGGQVVNWIVWIVLPSAISNINKQ